MQRFALIAVAVTFFACETGPTDDTMIPTQFAMTFPAVRCRTEITINNAPCVTSGSASGQDWVDSGRITFNTNNSVDWKLGTHRYSCPCYLGGCTTPCSHGPPVVTQVTGTYTISADTIVLQFGQDPDPQANPGDGLLKLYTKIPERVPKTWTGPDSLEYGRVFYSVIFTKQ